MNNYAELTFYQKPNKYPKLLVRLDKIILVEPLRMGASLSFEGGLHVECIESYDEVKTLIQNALT